MFIDMNSMVWNPDQTVPDHPILALVFPSAIYGCVYHPDWTVALPQLPLKLGGIIPVMDVWRPLQFIHIVLRTGKGKGISCSRLNVHKPSTIHYSVPQKLFQITL